MVSFGSLKAGWPVYRRVEELLTKAAAAGIQACLIEVETFDELMGDLAQQIEEMPPEVLGTLNKMRSKVSNVPLPQIGTAWPVIRDERNSADCMAEESAGSSKRR